MMPVALDRGECWGCSPPKPERKPNPADAKWCRKHLELAEHAGRAGKRRDTFNFAPSEPSTSPGLIHSLWVR